MKACPTAEGFGENAVGGRGGKVIFVENLNDSGVGSFREAALYDGPRIIDFSKVSGTIQQKSIIDIRPPFITIAGQTSPGGVQFRGPNNNTPAGISFGSSCHDIIVRHMRIRIGGPCPDDVGEPFLCYGTGGLVYNVFIDHCSIQWGTDAQWMFYGSCDFGTMQYCIVANGANNSTFGDGSGSGKGIHIRAGRWNQHHNLLANNAQRNPLIQSATLFDQRNDLVYNWDNNNCAEYGSLDLNAYAQGNVINNHYIVGPEGGTPIYWINNGATNGKNVLGQSTPGSKLYTRGNWADLRTGPVRPSTPEEDFRQFFTQDYYGINGTLPQCDPAIYRAASEFVCPPVTTDPTSAVKEKVLATAGACMPFRDSVDAAVVQNVISGTGCTSRTRGCIGNGGPWPDLQTGAPVAPVDSNRDGIPDYFALHLGFTPMADMANKVDPANGYTNIENYQNYLAGDFPGLHVPIIDAPDDQPDDQPDEEDPLPTLGLPRPLSNPEYVAFTNAVDIALLNLPPWGGIVKWNNLAVLVYEAPGGLFLTDVTSIMDQIEVAPPWTYHPEVDLPVWHYPAEVAKRIQELIDELLAAAKASPPYIAIAVAAIIGLLVWRELK